MPFRWPAPGPNGLYGSPHFVEGHPDYLQARNRSRLRAFERKLDRQTAGRPVRCDIGPHVYEERTLDELKGKGFDGLWPRWLGLPGLYFHGIWMKGRDTWME